MGTILLHMHEGPSSDLQLSDKSWVLCCMTIIPALGAWGQVDAGSWLDGQSSQNGELQVQRDALWRVIEKEGHSDIEL